MRELVDKYFLSRSTIFKRTAREKWKQNAALIEATRKQIVEKLESKDGKRNDGSRSACGKQVIADLQPWIEREKAQHIKGAVRMAKRGFERTERLWDERDVADSKAESLGAAPLDKHDAITRGNLGMNQTSAGSCSVKLHVLTGGRTSSALSPHVLAAKHRYTSRVSTRWTKRWIA